ncbi:MAG: DEAD/DEAH box helicase family protein [Minisyncoccia bacterium]
MESRWYQDEAEQSVFDYYEHGNTGNPLIALPTGTGKSFVIARIIKRAMASYPGQRIIVCTHVKELLEQNSKKLSEIWPTAPFGIFSAGLKRHDTALPIIFGGIASVKNQVKAFGHRDLMFIDEAHLLSPNADTMYHQVIGEMQEINPYMKVIGLTATPYRLGQGLLTDSGLFTDIVCDMTSMKAFNRLVAEGYIAPLIPRPTNTKFDISNVGISKGEYIQGQLEEAVDKDAITYAACQEMVAGAADRGTWLVFASGIKHAEHVAEMLRRFGITAVAVHSKMAGGNEAYAKALRDYKNGVIRCLVANNKMTTGVDHPPIDFIGMLRPTVSPGLWVQMLGRGTRPSPETMKKNCLCFDFAGNTARLGPINDPMIPGKRGKGSGDVPVKICEACGTYNHISARECCYCGAEFDIRIKLVKQADTQELIRTDAPLIEEFKVDRVMYNRHTKPGAPDSMRVGYVCGLRFFEEYVSIEHPHPFAAKRARDWWRRRMGTEETPPTTEEALRWSCNLAIPRTIKVHVNKKYPEVVECCNFYRVGEQWQ